MILSTAVRALTRRKRILAACLLATALPWLGGCSTNPATGESMLSLMSPEEERQIGAQESPKAIQQFGGLYKDPELTRYIDSIGQLLVKTSETPNEKFSFVVIDSDIVNAFALPGGYIHVTRGLLALANNEAEAAGVIAHEIGHVTARHAAQRTTRATLGGIGALVGAVLLGDVGAQLGQAGASAYVAHYSRDQEFQADSLGVRYLRRAGFDPEAMADFLASLQAQAALEAKIAGRGAEEGMNIMASHPRTQDRVQAAIKQAGDGSPVRDPIDGRDVYLRKIDGMIYGESPDHGFVRGTRFAHPTLRIGFEVPSNFKLSNQPQQVVAVGPQGSGILFSQAPSGIAPADYLQRVKIGGAALGGVQSMSVNGMPAATGAVRGNTQRGPVDVRVVAIQAGGNAMYQFLLIAPAQIAGQLSDGFQRTVNSFRRLSQQEADALRPLRVRVVTVRAGDTIQSLAARSAFPDNKLQRFLVLNGLREGATLRPGQLIKTVLEGNAGQQGS